MGTVNLSRIRPVCGRNLLKPRPGINDLEVVEGCENVAEKLKLTVPFCEIGRFEWHLCCRTCAFEEVCTKAEVFHLPCQNQAE